MPKNLLNFEEFLLEKNQASIVETSNTLEASVTSLVNTMKPGKHKLEDVVLDAGDRKWIITGVSPDKVHGDLKVFYKDSEDEKEKKVDLFDFHISVHQQLFDLIKKNLPKL